MPAMAAEDLLDARLESMALAAALQRLPDQQRDALLLRFVSGYSTDEIAPLLNKTPAAVYSLQSRVLVRLRRSLNVRDFTKGPDENDRQLGIDTVK